VFGKLHQKVFLFYKTEKNCMTITTLTSEEWNKTKMFLKI